MGPSLRSAIQSHSDQNSGSSTGTSSHPMMSHQGSSQSGGKKRRGRRSSKGKKYRRRSKRAGSSCGTKTGGSARSRAAKGGMMAPGLGAVIKEALVPFGIFALQKRTQRRKHSGKKFEKSRRR
jgi:hypothetical protein|uniref:Uncharacterized protein n=1 Tax=viral metagenome TaxID=1070528 RepID=A0A6C0CZ20_9ZZZZ